MRKAGTERLVRIAVTAVLFGLLLCGSAAAERTLTAGCPSVCNETVTARKEGNNWVLSLPGCWDLSKLTLELSGSATVRIGREELEVAAGQTADLSAMAGERQKLLSEKGKPAGYVKILQGSEIPALFLTVDGNELKKVNQKKGYPAETGRAVFCEADGRVSCDGELSQLKARGNTTFNYPKKPYQFRLKEKASLCGMSSAKTWVLLANWLDVSLLRNQIVLDISRAVGLRYAVGCEQTDVWINGSYQGLYLLTETIQIGRGRVDITDLEKATEEANDGLPDPGEMDKKRREGYKMFRSYPSVQDPEDITGGYIMNIEKNYRMLRDDAVGFRTENMLNIRIREPDYPSTAQVAYLGGLIRETEHALLAEDGIAPETGKAYDEYLDVDSFARKFLIEDWCKNYDAMCGSQYLYKDSDRVDPLIYAGPAWDYDLSFGNMWDKGYLTTASYLANFQQDNNIYWLLYRQDGFRERLSQVWRESFRQAAAVVLGEIPAPQGSALRSFDEYRDRIEASARMNFSKWEVDRAHTLKYAGRDFRSAAAFLKNWITEHTRAMDELYGSGDTEERPEAKKQD